MKPYFNASMTNEQIRGTIAASNYFTSMFALAIIAVMIVMFLACIIVVLVSNKKEKMKNREVNKHANRHISIVSVFKK